MIDAGPEGIALDVVLVGHGVAQARRVEEAEEAEVVGQIGQGVSTLPG